MEKIVRAFFQVHLNSKIKLTDNLFIQKLSKHFGFSALTLGDFFLNLNFVESHPCLLEKVDVKLSFVWWRKLFGEISKFSNFAMIFYKYIGNFSVVSERYAFAICSNRTLNFSKKFKF